MRAICRWVLRVANVQGRLDASQPFQSLVDGRRAHSKDLLCGCVQHEVHTCEPAAVDVAHGMRHRATLVKARRKRVDERRGAEASGDERKVERDPVHARAGHLATQGGMQCVAEPCDTPTLCRLGLRHGRCSAKGAVPAQPGGGLHTRRSGLH